MDTVRSFATTACLQNSLSTQQLVKGLKVAFKMILEITFDTCIFQQGSINFSDLELKIDNLLKSGSINVSAVL